MLTIQVRKKMIMFFKLLRFTLIYSKINFLNLVKHLIITSNKSCNYYSKY